MRHQLAMTVALLTTLGLGTACDDEPTGPDEEEEGYLSPAELNALVGTLMSETLSRPFSAGSGTLQPDSAGPIVVPEVDSIMEFAAECPRGGEVSIQVRWSIAVDKVEDTMTLETSGTREPRECARAVYPTPQDPLVVTITGDPGLASSAQIVHERTWSPGDPLPREIGDVVGTMAVNGAFIWETNDGRSGRCEIDVTSHFSYDAETRTGTGSRQGTVCGRGVGD